MGRNAALPLADAHPARIAAGFFPRRKENGGAPAGSKVQSGAAIAERRHPKAAAAMPLEAA